MDEIREAVFDCLKRFELKKKVRLVGVKVGRLKKDGKEYTAVGN